MLSINVDTIRLFLHILAATVWVGGQLTLAGLLPTLRSLGPDAPRAAARQFNRIAWAAFVVLVVTGIWNMLEVHLADASGRYLLTLTLKIVVVVLSGFSAAWHSMAKSRVALAAGGAAAGLTALLALFLGVLLVFHG